MNKDEHWIGVDLDGVIGKFAEYVLEQLYICTGRVFGLEDVFYHKLTDSFPGFYQYVEDITKEPDILLKIGAYKDNIRVMNSIKSLYSHVNIKYCIITARKDSYPDAANQTKIWLDKYNFPYDKIIISGHNDPKGLIAKDIGAKLFLEDKYENIVEIDSRGIDTILVSQPWNQGKKLPEKTVVVSNSTELHKAMMYKIGGHYDVDE